ncbi:LpqB family beta-propeller domain-containing protein [Streptomyces sp. NPDC006997]|uniref:LpqB family beta-propeller domain-containing protein n=1 Tax=Streptomyces sp. NPDC006997 TaxID=3155356 RepID=UPI0034051463
MGTERAGGAARRAPGRALAYAACGVVLLAGCASMPDHGDLRDVESTPRQDTQVRVFAMPPREDAEPSEIMQGFLEALTSDDPQYETARQYLTDNAARNWRPELSTTVLANGPDTATDLTGDVEDDDDYSFTLTGTKIALVDAQQSYAPADGQYSRQVRLIREKKSEQWRIDGLPQGIVIGESDFQRNYMSVNKYYFASNAADPEAGTGAQPAAVADPVYVRRRVAPMTHVVHSLLNGPTNWLGDVVRSSFPTGTALPKGAVLTPDEQNRLTVPLNGKAARVGSAKCNEMAAQLLFTLQNLTPAVDEVELRAGDRKLCELREDRASAVAAVGSARHADYLYFLDGKHRLVRIPADSGATSTTSTTSPEAVPGALGEGVASLRSAAVARDEHTAAGVGLDGKALYVGSLASGGSLGDPVLLSAGKTEADRLTAPSWDAHGNLWVADRDPGNPRLLMLRDGKGEPLQVRTPSLDGRIKSLRVAADGVRIALVVEKDDEQSLLVGRIEWERVGEQRAVWIRELRSATPELSEVTAMSWAGDSRLVVVGREEDGVQQMRYVQVDGSVPEGPAPDALTGVREIAASEDERLPLVAFSSEDGIVRMESGTQWQKVVKEGAAPVYPG